jgi:peptidoglycan/xylan/chitin deacetylase (PgdA/CDA1 family)
VIPILLYHSVSDEASPVFAPWAVAPREFEAQLRYLRQNDFSPLTVSQLVSLLKQKLPLPEKPVVITFDDGFLDFYTSAWPLLRHYECTATLYVVTSYMGQTSRWLVAEGESKRPMMSWDQLRDVQRQGIECGAHTQTHPQLDTLSRNAARDEIVGSKRVLEAHLGRPVTSFAFPHGYHSPSVKQLVREAGFNNACAVKHAMSFGQDDLFALSRIIVYADTDIAAFAKLLRGETVGFAPTRENLHTKGWRLYRRAVASFAPQNTHAAPEKGNA